MKCSIHNTINQGCRSGKTLTKIIRYIVGILLILLCIYLFLRFIPGQVRPDTARKIRVLYLQEWHKLTQAFISQKSELPQSLYEVYINSKEYEGVGIMCFYQGGFLEKEERAKALTPEGFAELSDYVLCQGCSGKKSWYIKELHGDLIYTHTLMIDQDGRIYEIRELPQDN